MIGTIAARAVARGGLLGRVAQRAGLTTVAPGADAAAGKAAAAAPAPPAKYSSAAMWLHWLTGAGFLTCIGTVKLSQWTPKDEPTKYGMTKGELMNIHKSTALLVAGLMVPRVAVRLAQKAPPLPPGNMLEHAAAKVSHFALYGLMLFLPGSGIAMGYFGGKGLPFFGYTIPGAEEPNKAVAGQAFKNHKLAGQVFTYLVPLHVGAVGFHAAKGQNIMARMLP